MEKDPIVIVGYARTPQGAMLGSLSDVSATDLGATAIKAAVERSKVAVDTIDEVIMGCVLPAGLGQAPARQAALGAGLPNDKACTTVNKMCGSGMRAIMMAHDQIAAGSSNIMIAGGMESMTNAPYLLPKARAGMRMGHGEIIDHMFLDGLEDAYDKGKLMGVFAENTAQHYQFTREDQDGFTINSLKKAQMAIDNNDFDKELAAVTYETRKGSVTVEIDEIPGNAKIDKIPTLRPAFSKDGTVTAANSSSISDGAAAVVMMKKSEAEKQGANIIATIAGHASFAQEPEWFTTAPVGSIKKLMEQTGWSVDDVDLWEVNEAFAVVAMAAIRDLDLPPEKVNIHGGACALGHPIGASGTRIVCTLLAAMEKHDAKKGIASLCIGGGEATALAVERS